MSSKLPQKIINIPNSTKSLGSLGDDNIFVIAEIGKNFIQSEDERSLKEYLKNALELIDLASECGVDAVKFQTHVLEDEFVNLKVTSPHFKGSDRYNWIKRNERATPVSFWRAVKQRADERGLIFFSTPMSKKSAIKLNKIGVNLWKLGSGDVTDNVAIDYIAGTGKPLIISTGMVSLAELDGVIAHIQSKGIELCVLYCVSQYPCPPELFNLSTIELLKNKYPNVVIGFSDHSIDSHEVDLSAIKLGARVIEKHFSLSRGLWGSDHKASILPNEMRAMVRDIRNGKYKRVNYKKYYGDKTKEMEGAKNKFRPYFNKSLVAGRDIARNTLLTKSMIYAMRPKMFLKGFSSSEFANVVGKKTKLKLKKYQAITKEDIE